MFEISYLMVNLFSTYIVLFTYSIILGKRRTNRLVYYLSFLGYFLITSTIYLIFDVPIYNIVCNIITLFLVTFNYDASARKRLIVTLSFFVFVASIESFVVFLHQMLVISSYTGEISTILGMAISKILLFILCATVLRKFDIKQNTKLTLSQTLSIFVVTIGVLVLTYVLMTIHYENMALVLVSIMTLCTVCIFIFNFISITIRSQIEDQLKKSLELQSESYLNELKIVNSAQNEIRYLKHDIANHLNTIQALINQNHYSEIQKYIESINGTLKKSVKVSNTDIEELDSIINLKISKANECGIKVDANIRIEKKIVIAPQDYVSIIGNLFDNAIEAVANVDSDCKHIDFKIGLITSLLVIRIENPYRHKIVTRDDGFMTTKQNKMIHGFGLMHVSTLVDKYEGIINITYEDNFIVEISMFNK